MRETVKNRATAHRFAFYPPVLLVRRASSFRPASAPEFPTDRSLDRPASVTRDVSNRRLPLERLTAPAPRAFPVRSPDLHRADAPRSLRSPHSMTGGTDVSRRPDRFGGSYRTRFPIPWSISRRSRHRLRSRAWAFSSHGARYNRASDIPVASHSRPRSHAPSCVQPLSSIRLRPFGCACGSLG
jgi:hypothetical protein